MPRLNDLSLHHPLVSPIIIYGGKDDTENKDPTICELCKEPGKMVNLFQYVDFNFCESDTNTQNNIIVTINISRNTRKIGNTSSSVLKYVCRDCWNKSTTEAVKFLCEQNNEDRINWSIN